MKGAGSQGVRPERNRKPDLAVVPVRFLDI